MVTAARAISAFPSVGTDSIFEVTDTDVFDAIIVGAGISGSFIADTLTARGQRVLVLEAGRHYEPEHYPRTELDANSQLYWGGGIEFNETADIGFLRPKVVGGGSIVNQALVDRFDALALDSWRAKSGLDFLTPEALAPHYDEVESRIRIQTIPAEYRNGNARIFEEGFQKNGYRCAPLKRAQRDCRYAEGNDCIECLAGCPLQSKQSMPWTTLARARATGKLRLLDRFEVNVIEEDASGVQVSGQTAGGLRRTFRGKKGVLASGAIGNTKLLFLSGFGDRLPALGNDFFTHPQYMNLALYDREVNSHKGPFQAFKSDDPGFRSQGFKLENVFAPPVSLSMLLPGIGTEHQAWMKRLTRLACIEIAVRDTHPGTIRVDRSGRLIVKKTLNDEDRRRWKAGWEAVEKIFRSTGAKEILPGAFGIGLHLMGGCALGTDERKSVVGPDFRLHGSRKIFAADSSVFPDAPGINPSLTIMALASRAAEEILNA
jgi:choline dehydrogenase-like flavoprotein